MLFICDHNHDGLEAVALRVHERSSPHPVVFEKSRVQMVLTSFGANLRTSV